MFWDLKANINKEKNKYDEFFNNRVSVVFNATSNEVDYEYTYLPSKEFFHTPLTVNTSLQSV